MEDISAYILSLLSVLEKELALLRLSAGRTVQGIKWSILGALLLMVGVLVLAHTCFVALSQMTGPVIAGFISAGLIFLGGGSFLWLGGRYLK
jgi:hypothetical protein